MQLSLEYKGAEVSRCLEERKTMDIQAWSVQYQIALDLLDKIQTLEPTTNCTLLKVQ